MNMVQAINLALRQEMERDESVLILGEDVGKDGGVFRVTDGLLDAFGPERVIDTPLAESGIVGSAVGMAIAGLRPVCEMQFDGFSYLMIPQLEGNASRYRARTRSQRTVPMVVRIPYGGGVRALEHHSEARETFYAFPGVKVVVPSGPRNARSLMASAIRDPDPVVFLEPKRSYRAFKEEVPESADDLPIGKAQVVRQGTDLTVVSWGAMMRPVIQAVEDVASARSVTIELIDLLTLAPMDAEAVASSVRKTGRLVVVQESPRSFGVASEVIAQVNDRSFLYLEAPVKRVTGYDVVTPYFGRENLYIPGVERIRNGIEETLDF
jgi:pyruvate dehydrogenase E1 component beta subunit